ncbi:recombinase family protein [Chryseobacterium aureum]|uniref:recombinase family protein n=1 Tax=Chryseobacterium aureum TaxID=2497456 RepID=UPI000F88CC31|nr:recombinase family protein [Chryseobacterium aureum]
MKIGYARVSTKDQNLDLQIEALEKAGCEKIYQEKISGTTKNRPELDKMIEQFREGDELYVWRLDRLGRSLKNIIDLVLSLSDKGIIIKGISDGVDTSTMNGRLFLNLMASLSEYERELIRERTNAGLQSARARGRTGGRPKGFTKEKVSKLIIMRSLYRDNTKTPEEIYKALGLTRATFYRYAKILDSHTNEEIKEMEIKKR